MLILTKKDIAFTIMTIILVVCSIVAPISMSPETIEVMGQGSGEKNSCKIIIDAGHGEPDGGAVSEDGTKESLLNLQIAKKLQEVLEAEGMEIIMTREDEENIADANKQATIREIKVSDINNRIEIANQSGADFLISIHMNKYSESKYKGWQTFYSKNSEKGKKLAESIQEGIKESVGLENKREALKIEGIKLIDKSTIPAVIVECGFLSNPEEKELLKTKEYQDKLVEGIKNGVLNYLK